MNLTEENKIMKAFQPVIKWSGSKRSQAEKILSYFPKEIDTYYEPFCGGASILKALMDSDITVKQYVASDINRDLINLFNEIKNNPNEVISHYATLWHLMNDGTDSDKEYKKRFFEAIRTRYNQDHNPLDFMFIMRTTTNGMPRYNSKGEFNNSFHITRNGIIPMKLEKIVQNWSNALNKNKVEFRCCSFDEITPSENDLVYIDPPYANTKGMYFGNFDNSKLFEWIKSLKCKWIMSYDGISGKENNTFDVPRDLYDEHIYLKSGNSSFKRVIGKDRNAIVYESLYLKG